MPANIDYRQVIRKPLISEKATYAMNEQMRYSFLVDPRATKTEIKDAVQKLYKVRVGGVNTVLKKGKHRRLKAGVVQEPLMKKAVVRLHADDKIELF